MDTIERAEILLNLSGLIILFAGVSIGLSNMKGWLLDKEKGEVLEWVLHSKKGLSVQHPGAKKFMQHFLPLKKSRPKK